MPCDARPSGIAQAGRPGSGSDPSRQFRAVNFAFNLDALLLVVFAMLQEHDV